MEIFGRIRLVSVQFPNKFGIYPSKNVWFELLNRIWLSKRENSKSNSTSGPHIHGFLYNSISLSCLKAWLEHENACHLTKVFHPCVHDLILFSRRCLIEKEKENEDFTFFDLQTSWLSNASMNWCHGQKHLVNNFVGRILKVCNTFRKCPNINVSIVSIFRKHNSWKIGLFRACICSN